MQIINRDNYETWLMLYLDNELTATEREAVEAFAKANPDVQEELNGLKEVLLQPELPAAMPGKERLLMPDVWNEEALTPQQEQLLMLADNELPAGQKELLETEIEGDPILKKEWQLMSAAILQPEQPAEMPFKERLFRSGSSRVIPIGRILRFAAAAAILAFGWFAIQQMTGSVPNEENQSSVVKAEAEIKEQIAETGEPKTDEAVLDKEEKTKGNSYSKEVAISGKSTEEKIETFRKKEIMNEAVAPVLASNAQTVTENNASSIDRDLAGKIGTVTYVDVDGVDETTSPLINNVGHVDVTTLLPEQKPIMAYEVVNAEEIMEEETISIAGARIPKQKIRSLYRNITRPLARSLEKNQAPRTEVK
jgi:hypothetical protein